jgi:hypothetical protein
LIPIAFAAFASIFDSNELPEIVSSGNERMKINVSEQLAADAEPGHAEPGP